MNILSILKPIGTAAIKHLPEILVGTGIAGMGVAVIFAVRAKPAADKAREELYDKHMEAYDKGETESTKPSKKEEFKCVAPHYIPAGAMFVLSSGLIIGALVVSNKRYSALAALYSLGAETIKEQQLKINELAGREEAARINKEINEKVESKREIKSNKHVKRFETTHRWSRDEALGAIPGDGPDLIYDKFGGGFFWSSRDAVERAFLNVKSDAIRDIGGDYSINEFRTELGLPETDAGYLSFESERGRVNELVWDEYSPDGKILAWAFTFRYQPTDYTY